MTDPALALAAAARPAAPTGQSAKGSPRVLVLGGGGALGARVVERLLAGRRFEAVGVWTVQPLQAALRGLVPLADSGFAHFRPRTAVVVFDRARHANGREAAFGQPQPDALPALAAQLRAAGVTTLVVVVPHAPGLLPQALKSGLASLDEAAVAALGFLHLVFMRSAQAGPAADATARGPARLARWLLSQLHWMVPQGDQPVRSDTVARVAAQLALALPGAAPGTRVLPPELLWAAAQTPDTDSVVDDWLAGRPLAPPGMRRRWSLSASTPQVDGPARQDAPPIIGG
jgi:nucleoside-diphosphate-sugar epimerase